MRAAFPTIRSFCLPLLAALLCLPATSGAVNTGKIAGRVTDKATGQGLPAVTIRIKDTTLGALANDKGEYFILQVPPGAYTLQISAIGYVPVLVQGVTVNVDLTTFQHIEMVPTVLEVTEAIVVLAERSVVDKSLTSSRTLIELEEIESLPPTELDEFIQTTANSFAGNLRGGRPQDRQTTLDGAVITESVTNNGQALTVNPFMIQELAVRTGAYTVEYPTALAGLTTVTTREGDKRFSGNINFRTLAQKGLNLTPPPPIDLADLYRRKFVGRETLQDLIRSAIRETDGFNSDPARLDDGLQLRSPFDVLDTTSTDPAAWTARYDRSNLYWDYDRVNPDPDAVQLFSYLSQGLPFAQGTVVSGDPANRLYHPDKYNRYQKNNRTEKRPTQLDWGLGGPLGSKLNWFASGRFAEDWGRMPNDYHRTLSFYGKMSIRPTATTKLSLAGSIEDQGYFSKKGQRDTPFRWKYNAEGLNQRYDGRLHANLQFTHALSKKTFYEVGLSHMREYNERYNPKYGKSPLPSWQSSEFDSLGYNPYSGVIYRSDGQIGVGTTYPFLFITNDEAYSNRVDRSPLLLTSSFPNQVIRHSTASGVGYYPFNLDPVESTTFRVNHPFTTNLNVAITSQVTVNHQVKAGVTVSLYDYLERIRRIPNGGGGPTEDIFTEDNPGLPNSWPWSGVETHVYPSEYGLFVQDRIEYGNLVANVGLRLDIFNPNTNGINPFQPGGGGIPDPQTLTAEPSIKKVVSPRLGLSHQITERAALHYSYGVFNQRPSFNDLYYGLVQRLHWNGESLHGNPDLPYQKSANYEMGVQAEVYPGYHLDLTGYYRDASSLPKIATFISLEPEGPTQRILHMPLPVDAQDARGLEVSFRKRMRHRFALRANYTLSYVSNLQSAFSGPFFEDQAAFDYWLAYWLVTNSEPEGNTSYYVQWPSFFDRRHRLVASLMLDLPLDIDVSFLTTAQSGHLFPTRELRLDENRFGQLLGRTHQAPWTATTDLFARKSFRLGRNRLGVFTRIRNLFNRRNIYWVAQDGGPVSDRWAKYRDPVTSLGEPLASIGAQASTPRDIYVGVDLSW